jgi:hypothetical protein
MQSKMKRISDLPYKTSTGFDICELVDDGHLLHAVRRPSFCALDKERLKKQICDSHRDPLGAPLVRMALDKSCSRGALCVGSAELPSSNHITPNTAPQTNMAAYRWHVAKSKMANDRQVTKTEQEERQDSRKKERERQRERETEIHFNSSYSHL